MMKKIVIAALAAIMFAGSGLFVAPRPAQADTNSTIAIAAAAIVGILLFDESNRPYYDRDGYRCYVSDDVADYYFQNYYGGWYGGHRHDWYYNRRQFVYDWDRDRGFDGGGYNRGYQSNYNGGYQRPVNYNYHPVNYDRGYQRPVNNDRGNGWNQGQSNQGSQGHWNGNAGGRGNGGNDSGGDRWNHSGGGQDHSDHHGHGH
jgi:hypothetical protein